MGLVASDQLSWSGISSLWILLLALTYFLAGLHLERRLIPIGIVLAAGYLVTLYLPEYGATHGGCSGCRRPGGTGLAWRAGGAACSGLTPTSTASRSSGPCGDCSNTAFGSRSACCSPPTTRCPYSRLKQVLGETDGSLGTHLRKLEDGGYLVAEKSFRDRRPVTWYELTDRGPFEPQRARRKSGETNRSGGLGGCAVKTALAPSRRGERKRNPQASSSRSELPTRPWGALGACAASARAHWGDGGPPMWKNMNGPKGKGLSRPVPSSSPAPRHGALLDSFLAIHDLAPH